MDQGVERKRGGRRKVMILLAILSSPATKQDCLDRLENNYRSNSSDWFLTSRA